MKKFDLKNVVEKVKTTDYKKLAKDFWYGKPHGERRLGDLYCDKTGLYKHREWRGLKDTWYDYVEWVKVLGIMGGFVAKSPVRIARGMLTYRWMGSYLAALNMIDRCVEGLRGPALRVARLKYSAQALRSVVR